ncbi:hypothetical protein HGG71_05650 [Rhodobacteraceae bacterium R_SAG2]|nr:hypothetical protein [Rhodobacteraceae bacterium R_SAG2]
MLLPIVPASYGDFNVTLAGGMNITLSTLLASEGWDEVSTPVIYVTGNVGSTSTATPALICDVENARIVVEPGVYISGKGGNGGNGYITATDTDATAGEDGGPAISATELCHLSNSGTIQGGGGGGGGGWGFFDTVKVSGDGGGGGAGLNVGSGGIGGGDDGNYNGTDGNDGTLTAGGAYKDHSGAGGDPGEAGEVASTAGGRQRKAGGASGESINGYSLVTYSGAGDLLGPTA